VPGRIRRDYTQIPGEAFPRPYVTLELVGPSEDPLVLMGLLDTGADYSTLPLEVASELGFPFHVLDTVGGRDASRRVTLWRAEEPIAAKVLGWPATFVLEPFYTVVDDKGERRASDHLWGRRDFLRYWDLHLSERDLGFELEWRL
jgi:hypothetical protein